MTLAVLARVNLIFLLIGLSLAAQAQPRFLPQPNYGQLKPPDQAEGRRVLEEFRAKGIAGDYYLQIELHVLPRRGDEHVLTGRIWGTRTVQGPLSRIEIVTDPVTKTELRLLVQNGPEPACSSKVGDNEVRTLGPEALMQPIAGTNLTAFDLQMSFLYWPDFAYEGLVRMRGRPTHQFLLYPPKEFAEKYPALSNVRVYLDTQFNALVQTELLGSRGEVIKTISLMELKRVQDQWIPRSIDIRDEATRDKTRLVVTGAALGLTLPREIFDKDQLAKEAAKPPAERIVPIE
ncbi:MAG: outer membrane lipoprotein-sorting protein [Verrucomicrobiota bacterium]|nr:outer membrane lipoprotein-sorting protein [Verrucomicrobiota bacterium]